MFKARKLVQLLILILILSGLIFSPAKTQVVQALGTATVVYNLFATDGFVTLADGTQAYIYGFVGGRTDQPLTYLDKAGVAVPYNPINGVASSAPEPTGGAVTAAEAPLLGNAQFPAPVIYSAVGDIVEIRLKNLGVTVKAAPNDPHTIHLHGMDVDAANDGVPETSVAAVPANSKFPGAGNVVVYMYSPEFPGTYMYHCHQEANIHVQMGMYGALVVYNQGDAGASDGPNAGGGELWGWKYDKDYILLLSEFDMGQHKAEQFAGAAGAYNSVNYKPQYWFINGLSFPNTIHVNTPGFNWAAWSQTHPGYDPFIVGDTEVFGADNTRGEKVLLRVINLGFQTQPMHMHGYHAKVIGSDQRAWSWANAGPGDTGDPRFKNLWSGGTQFNEGMEKNTLTVGSGETYEWLIDFGQQQLNAQYAPAATDRFGGSLGASTFGDGTQSKMTAAGAPISNAATGLSIPDPFVPGETYIGGPVVGPDGSNLGDNLSVAQVLAGGPISGQLFPFHNHDDYKATNNGVYPGGMFTMIMTTGQRP